MKKTYQEPMIEIVEIDLNVFLAASIGDDIGKDPYDENSWWIK